MNLASNKSLVLIAGCLVCGFIWLLRDIDIEDLVLPLFFRIVEQVLRLLLLRFEVQLVKDENAKQWYEIPNVLDNLL